MLFCLVLMSCKKESTTEDKSSEQVSENIIQLSETQFKNGDFKLTKADSTVFYEEFKVTGYVDVPPQNRASINSFFSGFVSQIDLITGDEVKNGDLLVKLQNPEFIQIQQEFLENYSQLDFLETEFKRKKNLLDDKVISKKVFQQTRSEYLSMKAKIQGQQKTLELMNINISKVLNGQFSETISLYAPISGKISKVNVSKGSFVEPNTMIMEILDTDHIHLELDVFEKDIMKIKVGDTLEFKIPEIKDEIFKAYVKLVGAEIGENRSVRAHAHPISENSNFAVGMFIEAHFKHKPLMSLSLPETAFAKTDQAWIVLRLKDQKEGSYNFEMIEVQTSNEQFGKKPLKNKTTIRPNDRFLSNGVFDLVAGE